MEDTIGATPLPAATEQLPLAAVRYTEERHWDVFPGTWLNDSGERCSCGAADCPLPGAHPARSDWSSQATGSADAVRRMWAAEPRAAVLLPTGRSFDAVDVPEVAGCLALARMERMGIALGPVLCLPTRRLIFFVLPGAVDKVPGLLRRLGWSTGSLDLVVRGDGDYVVAAPTRIGTSGSAQWARRPTALNRWLPDVAELINPLAYACGREAAARLGR